MFRRSADYKSAIQQIENLRYADDIVTRALPHRQHSPESHFAAHHPVETLSDFVERKCLDHRPDP